MQVDRRHVERPVGPRGRATGCEPARRRRRLPCVIAEVYLTSGVKRQTRSSQDKLSKNAYQMEREQAGRPHLHAQRERIVPGNEARGPSPRNEVAVSCAASGP